MLLHDNYIISFVKIKAVVEFRCKVECTNRILYIECVSAMAESDKTLIEDGNLSNNNRNSSVPGVVIPPSGTLPPDTHPTQSAAVSEPSTLKRKQTSFQITSVTVKGSRHSTDGGEDSADDLDDSHASSDVLDCSRTTDNDTDRLSEEIGKDGASVSPPSIPVNSKSDLPEKQDALLNASNLPSETSKVDTPSLPSGNVGVEPPTIPDQWQHRFRVVKIVSSEPFKRGRWLCMDFMDPPVPVVEAKPEASISTNMQLVSGALTNSTPSDRVAHIYEISPSDSYPGSISVAVGPDQIQQPMYGIFLPINNGQYPLITGMHSKAVPTPMQKEVKIQESHSSVAKSSDPGFQQNSQMTNDQRFTTQSAQGMPAMKSQNMPVPATMASMPHTTAVTMPAVSHHVPASLAPVSHGVTAAPSHGMPTAVAASKPPAVSQPHLDKPAVPNQLSHSEALVSPNVTASPSRPKPSQESHQGSLPKMLSTESGVETTAKPLGLSSANEMQPSVVQQTSNVATQVSTTVTAEAPPACGIPKSEMATPSQVVPNHVETKEPTPPSTQEVVQEAPTSKGDANGEESESTPSGTNTVAIDNKIEQAMDLVKSHLMFAVREEVDVLKEKITELMDRISQLEYENGFLRANATQQTLEQLNQTQLLQQQQQQLLQQQQNQQQQQQNQPSVSINSVSQQPMQQEQLNIQNQQPTS